MSADSWTKSGGVDFLEPSGDALCKRGGPRESVPEVVATVLSCLVPSVPCTWDIDPDRMSGNGGGLTVEGITTGAKTGVLKSNTSCTSGKINSPSSTMNMSSRSLLK